MEVGNSQPQNGTRVVSCCTEDPLAWAIQTTGARDHFAQSVRAIADAQDFSRFSTFGQPAMPVDKSVFFGNADASINLTASIECDCISVHYWGAK